MRTLIFLIGFVSFSCVVFSAPERECFVVGAGRPVRICTGTFTLMTVNNPEGVMRYFFIAARDVNDARRIRREKFPHKSTIPQFHYYEARTRSNYIVGRDRLGDYEM